jgi:hypothetical protein
MDAIRNEWPVYALSISWATANELGLSSFNDLESTTVYLPDITNQFDYLADGFVAPDVKTEFSKP